MIFYYGNIFILALAFILLFAKGMKRDTIINISILAFVLNIIYCVELLVNFNTLGQAVLFNILYVDKITLVTNIVLSVVFIVTLQSLRATMGDSFRGEIAFLLDVIFLGMSLIPATNELITLFLLLEIVSFSSIILIGSVSRGTLSNEAMLKYLYLNSFMSAFYLLGIVFVTLFLRTTHLGAMFEGLTMLPPPAIALILTLFLASILFKIGGFVFYNYSVDVYFGSDTALSGLFLSGLKIMGFMVLFKILFFGFFKVSPLWQEVLVWVAIFTMFAGNFLSLKQSNVKKILINSSIVHTGYILVGFSSIYIISAMNISVILFYIFSYALVSVASFLVLSLINGGKNLDDIKGLYYRNKLLGVALGIFMLSFIGFPFTIGFAAKFYLLSSALGSGAVILVLIAIINTIISLYYYLRILINIFFYQPSFGTLEIIRSKGSYLLILLAIIFVILGGVGIISPACIANFINFN